MNKSRFKKSLKFLSIIFVFCLVIFIGYYFITGKKSPFSELIENFDDNFELKDNYNGVYVYNDDLNGSKFMFRGCSITKISNYILIIDDEYFLYRSSCMGTILKGNGSTKDLNIEIDETAKTYRIKYNDNVYTKDSSVLDLNIGIDNIFNMIAIQPDTYQLLLKETQQEGYYYDLKGVRIEGLSSMLYFYLTRNSLSNSYDISIKSSTSDYSLYSVNVSNLDFLPDLYTFGKYLAIIEKNMSYDNSKYNYKFKVISDDGIIYNLDNMLPITIDDIPLTTDNSIYIKFDQSSRNFKVIIGNDTKFCSDEYNDENANDIVYYEFSISYTYGDSSFGKPVFSKIGYRSEGCGYINSLMG